MRNTKERGQFTLFVYKEKPNYYIGICLEFDIVKEGKNASEVMELLEKASIGYLQTVIKENLSDDLLNKRAPKKYWQKYKQFEELKKQQPAIPWEEFLRRYFYPQVLQERIYV
jgi:hypothetical protein